MVINCHFLDLDLIKVKFIKTIKRETSVSILMAIVKPVQCCRHSIVFKLNLRANLNLMVKVALYKFCHILTYAMVWSKKKSLDNNFLSTEGCAC